MHRFAKQSHTERYRYFTANHRPASRRLATLASCVLATFVLALLLTAPALAVTLDQVLNKGWNLVSVPIAPTDASPTAVFATTSQPLRVYRQMPNGTTVAAGANGFTSVASGIGYWVLANKTSTLTVEGDYASFAGNFTIPLQRGWNPIGLPWPSTYSWSSANVSVKNGAATSPLADAIAAGWLRGELRSYNPGGGTYDTVIHNATTPESLAPWRGYLLYSEVQGDLILKPPTPNATPPFSEILSPDDGALVTTRTAIIGTAVDTDLAQYTLDYAPAGSTTYTTLAVSSASVNNATLGFFDPTLLINGTYRLRLRATDLTGLTFTSTADVIVGGNQKPGLFTLTFKDIEVPLPGITITVTRTYDSRNKQSGDFGVGWSSDFSDVKVSESSTVGLNWEGTATGGGFGSFCIDPTRKHIVSVTLPDGKVDTFEAIPNPQCAQFTPIESTRFAMSPRNGTTSALAIIGDQDALVVGSFPGPIELTYFNGQTFNPMRYRLTTYDKVVLEISKGTGLEKLTKPSGESIVIERDGITHSAGRSIGFERDAGERITAIQDPEGRLLRYEYNDDGDLTKYTDAMGNMTRFGYDDDHLLISIIDPLGRMATRNEYDEDGRLTATIDAKGNRITFSNDLEGKEQVIVDQRGNVTRSIYDDDGNIVRKERNVTIDGVQTLAVTSTDYNADGNSTHEVDADGRAQAWEYDAKGNNTKTILDPGGLNLVTQNTFDADGKPLSVTAPDGSLTTLEYSPGGCCRASLEAINLPGGSSTQFDYDSSGRLIRTTDALGTYTVTGYDSLGNVAREEIFDATGKRWQRIDFVFDASGRKLSETSFRTVNSATETMTTRFSYNANGNIVAVTDALGHVERFEYDAIGRKTAEIDPVGRRTRYEYDEVGNRTRIVHPDNSFNSYVYDARHNLTQERDRDNRTTRHEYDEFDQKVKTIRPDGSEYRTIYTPGGHTAAELDGRGNRTDYEYDMAGRLLKITQPEVHDASRQMRIRPVTQYEYDAIGRRTAQTDANGKRTEYEYDARGRLITTRLPNGTTSRVNYDALGHAIERIDPEGRSVYFTYDPLGRNTSVAIPKAAPGGAAAVTAYEFNEQGLLVRSTDANQQSTRFTYDALGQQIRKIYPTGEIEQFGYNVTGQVVAATSPKGDLIRTQYDINQRLAAILYPNSSSDSFTYNKSGAEAVVRDASGTSLYIRDPEDRLALVSFPDQSFIHYTYDRSGNIAALAAGSATSTYEYDALDRLVSATSQDGETTRYGCDAVGNLVYTAFPNGVTTTYRYDSNYRLTRLETRNSSGTILSSYIYTVTPVGNRTKAVELSGRTVDYTYDDAYRLVEEKISDPGQAVRTIAYQYDAVGNRLTRSDGGMTTTYTYNANDQLTAEDTVASVAALREGGVLGQWKYAAPRSLYDVRGSVVAMAVLYFIAIFLVIRRNKGRRARRTEWLMPRWLTNASAVLLVPITFLASDIVLGVHAEASLERDLKSLASHIVHAYDANGNLTSSASAGQTNTYKYDFLDRLIEADIQYGTTPGVTRYTYNAHGVRTARVSGGQTTRFLVDSNRDLPQVLEEKTGASVVRYEYGTDLISQTRAGSGTSYFHIDGQLSTRQLTNAAGVITDTWSYDAFGRETDRTGTTVNAYLYNGEQFDPNSGFYFLRARYYNPDQGRFITRDPYAGRLQDPMSLHRYLYAYDNPVTRFDPSGLGETLIAQIQVMAIQAYTRVLGFVNKVRAMCTANGVYEAVNNLMYFFGLLLLIISGPGATAGGYYTIPVKNDKQPQSLKEIEVRFHFYKKFGFARILEMRWKFNNNTYISVVIDTHDLSKSKIAFGYNYTLVEKIICQVVAFKLELSTALNTPTGENLSSAWSGTGTESQANYKILSIGFSVTLLNKIKLSIPIWVTSTATLTAPLSNNPRSDLINSFADTDGYYH